MANNLIQIKRSNLTAIPTALAVGELAWSNSANVLYIGSTDGVSIVRIGGYQNPGTLTANQALVANSLLGINKVYTTNLQVNFIEANGAGVTGTAGWILYSGGSTSNAYWAAAPTGAGVNTANQWIWSNTQTFQNTITFGANLIINTAAITWVGNTTTSPTLTFANTGVIQTGNSTVTASPQVIVANSLGTTTINTTSITTNTVYVTAVVANTVVQKLNTIVSSATRVVLTVTSPQNMLITGSVSQSIQLPDATSLSNGTYYEFNNNTTNGMQIYYNDTTTTGPYIPSGAYYKVILLTNGTTNGTWDTHSYIPAGVGFGNTLLSMAGIPISGTGNVSPQTNVVMNIGTTALMYANVYSNNIVAFSLLSAGGGAFTANSIGVYHTGLVNAANFTTTGTVNTATVYATGLVNAANFVTTGTVNTATVYATGLVNAANFVTTGTVNTGTVFAAGQVNAASFTIGSAFIANTQNVVFTGTSISATSANLSVLNMSISGNLSVSGTVTTIDTTNLSVKDNVILLADQQATTTTFTDFVDAGFTIPTGNTSTTFYSGLARIVSASTNTNPYFKLFGGTSTLPSGTSIDTSANTGTLQAFLLPWGVGGAFVVNSTAINITASATVSSAIVANSLTLTTALGATSGGTGQTGYVVGDVLYASTTTALSKLSVPGSAANGQVLQIINNLPAYGTLDGGTF